MPDTKISALTTGTVFDATADFLVCVDVSDTSMAASGTDKKVSLATLAAALSPTALGAIGATTLLGNPTGSSASPSAITLGAGLAFSGSTLTVAGGGGGSGTVTTVSVVTANGVSGSVANATTTPAITLTLGDITPTSVAATGTVTGSNLSNTNTGDQTFASLSPLTTLGDLLVFTTVNTRLAGNITTTRMFLAQTGAGASSAAPVWVQPAFTDVTGTAAAAQLPTTGLVIATHTAPIGTATDGATVTFNLATNDWWQVTLGGNRTLALANATTGQVFYLKLIQDATGGRTISNWFTGITWYTSTFAAPTLPTGAAKAILCCFRCTGAGAYDGFVVGASGA
jgi:hypothetical protein